MPNGHGLICTAYIVKTYPAKWLLWSTLQFLTASMFQVLLDVYLCSAVGILSSTRCCSGFWVLSTREMPYKSPALLTSKSPPCSPLHNSLPLQHRDLVAHLPKAESLHCLNAKLVRRSSQDKPLANPFYPFLSSPEYGILHIVHHCDWFLVEHMQSFCLSPISLNSHARSRSMHTYDWTCFPAVMIEPSCSNIYVELCCIFLHWVHVPQQQIRNH